MRRSPSVPCSTDSSPSSSPVRPWFSEPTAPITCDGQVALRVGAAAVGVLPDALQMKAFDPLGRRQGDFFGEHGEGRFRGHRTQYLALVQPEDRRQFFRRQGGLVDLVRHREDRRRVFGGGEGVAAAIEQAAAQTGHGDRFGLLADGLGGELRALHSLQPEGAADDHAGSRGGSRRRGGRSVARSSRIAAGP